MYTFYYNSFRDLTIQEIKNKIKTEDGALQEWAKTVFQFHWNERRLQELKKESRIHWHIYNPAWTHQEVINRENRIIKRIFKDTKFMNSITHPYGINWGIDKDGITIHFTTTD